MTSGLPKEAEPIFPEKDEFMTLLAGICEHVMNKEISWSIISWDSVAKRILNIAEKESDLRCLLCPRNYHNWAREKHKLYMTNERGPGGLSRKLIISLLQDGTITIDVLDKTYDYKNPTFFEEISLDIRRYLGYTP